MLSTLQLSTDSLVSSIAEQRKDIEIELESVRKAVREMKEGELKREEWSKKIGGLVDEVIQGLPKVGCLSLSLIHCKYHFNPHPTTLITLL
jgi:peroxin-14